VTPVTQTDPGSWEWLKDAPALVVLCVLVVVFIWFAMKMNARNQDAHEKAQSGFAGAMQCVSKDLKNSMNDVCETQRGATAKLSGSIDRNTESMHRVEMELVKVCAHLNGSKKGGPAP